VETECSVAEHHRDQVPLGGIMEEMGSIQATIPHQCSMVVQRDQAENTCLFPTGGPSPCDGSKGDERLPVCGILRTFILSQGPTRKTRASAVPEGPDS
jgi:hypothetical protein